MIIETERLYLREFKIEDAAFLIELLNSETWIQFIGDRNVKTVKNAQKYILEKICLSYKISGFGFYLVLLKEENTTIGMCGLVKRDFLDLPDIGFAFLPEFTGLGLAFEAANATLNFAKDKLALLEIAAITTQENSKSITLLKKLGLQFEKTISLKTGEEMMLFKISYT